MPDRLKELNHIGIAVTDLEASKALFRDRLGFTHEGDKELPDRGLKVAFFSTGNTRIELLQGVTPDSAISKFVEKRGPGIHHLSFAVNGAGFSWPRTTRNNERLALRVSAFTTISRLSSL